MFQIHIHAGYGKTPNPSYYFSTFKKLWLRSEKIPLLGEWFGIKDVIKIERVPQERVQDYGAIIGGAIIGELLLGPIGAIGGGLLGASAKMILVEFELKNDIKFIATIHANTFNILQRDMIIYNKYEGK